MAPKFSRHIQGAILENFRIIFLAHPYRAVTLFGTAFQPISG